MLPECTWRRTRLALMDDVERAATGIVEWIYLDTGPNFTAAQSMYPARGYEACKRYNDNPQATCFFRKRLLA